jgi:hypothetical protein
MPDGGQRIVDRLWIRAGLQQQSPAQPLGSYDQRLVVGAGVAGGEVILFGLA